MSKFKSAIACVATAAFLAGCSTTAAGPHIQQQHRTVVSGERTRLGDVWNLTPDCSLASLPRLSVIIPPSHGSIEVVQERFFPHAKGTLAKCNEQKTVGLAAYYTSQPGYLGPDAARLRHSADGVPDFDIETHLNVVR